MVSDPCPWCGPKCSVARTVTSGGAKRSVALVRGNDRRLDRWQEPCHAAEPVGQHRTGQVRLDGGSSPGRGRDCRSRSRRAARPHSERTGRHRCECTPTPGLANVTPAPKLLDGLEAHNRRHVCRGCRQGSQAAVVPSAAASVAIMASAASSRSWSSRQGPVRRGGVETCQDPAAWCPSVDTPRPANEQDSRRRAGLLHQRREDIGVNSGASDGIDLPGTRMLQQ